MKKGLRLSLRPGERIFINGAVLRVDRKVSIELLNDAAFLLEGHVMQIENAVTDLKKLYFIIQSLLIDPLRSTETYDALDKIMPALKTETGNDIIRAGLVEIESYIAEGKPFEALRVLRGLFVFEVPGHSSTLASNDA